MAQCLVFQGAAEHENFKMDYPKQVTERKSLQPNMVDIAKRRDILLKIHLRDKHRRITYCVDA